MFIFKSLAPPAGHFLELQFLNIHVTVPEYKRFVSAGILYKLVIMKNME